MKIFKMKSLTRSVAALLSAALVSACSMQAVKNEEGSYDRHENLAKDSYDRASEDATRSAKSDRDGVSGNPESDGVWIGGRVIVFDDNLNSPVLKRSISINENYSTLNGFDDRFTYLTGISVRVNPGVSIYPGVSSATGVGGSSLPKPPGGGAPLPVGGMPGGMLGGMGMNSAQSAAHVNYNGTIKGLLDEIAAQFGAHWRYSNETVTFFRTETKSFELSAVPGDTSLAANVISGSSSSGGGAPAGGAPMGGAPAGGAPMGGAPMGGAPAGGAPMGGGGATGDASGSQTSVTSSLSVWTDVGNAVKSILSPLGQAVITPATGAITVTDDPDYIERVGAYIQQENEVLSRQVLLQVKVLSVSRTDADQYGINWNAVFNSMSKNIGITASNAFPAGPGVGSLSMNVLSSAGGRNLGQFAGSGAIIDALSSQGKVALVTSSTIVTLNNQPVPIQVGSQTTYLASVSNMVTANVGSQTSLTPGVVQTGFNMNILPHLLSGRDMLLQFSLNISSLNSLTTVSSGGNTIQTPNVDTRDFLQRVAMRSGETLVLSGFEQTTESISNQGIGSATNIALGGGVNASKNRDIVVIMITPILAHRQYSADSGVRP